MACRGTVGRVQHGTPAPWGEKGRNHGPVSIFTAARGRIGSEEIHMRRMGLTVAAVALAAAVWMPAVQADPVKVTGELIDVMCGTTKKSGDSHKACAESCAKRGEPVAVFSKDGMYTITGPLTENKNAKLIEFMAKQVTVTGEVTKDKDGKMTILATAIVPSK